MRAGKRFILFIPKGDMNLIINNIQSLEDSNVLIDGIAETVTHEIKETKRVDFFLHC